MNNFPRQKLCELILQYGRSLCDEPQRCEGFLRDFCGQYRKEISALIGAAREGIPGELISSQNSVPPVVLLVRLTKKLHENLALDEQAARWAVESWALALGVISSQYLDDISQTSGPPQQPNPSFSSPTSVQSPVNSLTTSPQSVTPQTPPSDSYNWSKFAIAGSAIAFILLIGSVWLLQIQQRQAIQQEIAELKTREEQRLEAEQRQRLEAERQLAEERSEREETERQFAEERSKREETERRRLEAEQRQRLEAERQLAEERSKREETERRLEAERERRETFVPSQSINEGEAISLIENLYYLLSTKKFDRAMYLYSPQLSESFSPRFFSQFSRVTVEDLRVTSRMGNSINFRGQNTYVYPDGSTQREIRSYTVINLGGELKITSSEFIKVTKFR